MVLVRKQVGRKPTSKQDSAKLAIEGAIRGAASLSAASLSASFGILSGPGAFLLGIDLRISSISLLFTP